MDWNTTNDVVSDFTFPMNTKQKKNMHKTCTIIYIAYKKHCPVFVFSNLVTMSICSTSLMSHFEIKEEFEKINVMSCRNYNVADLHTILPHHMSFIKTCTATNSNTQKRSSNFYCCFYCIKSIAVSHIIIIAVMSFVKNEAQRYHSLLFLFCEAPIQTAAA